MPLTEPWLPTNISELIDSNGSGWQHDDAASNYSHNRKPYSYNLAMKVRKL